MWGRITFHRSPAEVIRACEAAGNAATTIEGYAWQLAKFVTLILPDDYARYAWLRATCMRLTRVAKCAPRRRAVHGVRTHEFDMLGQRLIAEARASPCPKLWSTTERYRNGLFLRLGALCPERLKPFPRSPRPSR